MVTPSSLSTTAIHIPDQIVGNSSTSSHSDVNCGSSIPLTNMNTDTTSIAVAVLPDPLQIVPKSEYTEPKIEYS